MKPKLILFAYLSGTFLLAACLQSSVPITISMAVTSRHLPFPPAYYENIVYVNNKIIAFSRDPSAPPSERVSFSYEGDSDLHLFVPDYNTTCGQQEAYNVMGGILPDGRLGILMDCFAEAPAVRRLIFAYDWQTGAFEQIVRGPTTNGLLPKTFTWNPEMTKGVQEMGNGIEGTIYWITSEGASPMDIEIEDQGLKWNLKDYYEGKTRVGSAGTPAWSPDGNTIAFLASAYGIREEPLPKMNVKRGLYLMKTADLKPIQVIPEIANAFHLRWSPNNKQLLFSGCMGVQLQCGLWFYDVEAKSLALIEKGDFQDFTWITNEKIAAIKNITMPFDNNEIWEYSISW